MQRLTDTVTLRIKSAGAPPDLVERTAAIIRTLDDGSDPETPFPLEWDRATSGPAMRKALMELFGEDAEVIPVSVRTISRPHSWQTKQTRLIALKAGVDRMLWSHLRRRYEESLTLRLAGCEADFKSLHHELDDGLRLAISPRINAVLGYGTDEGLSTTLSTNLFCVLKYLAGFAMAGDRERFEVFAAMAQLLPGPLPLGTMKDRVAWLTIVR